jgi:hypothetical protein
MKARTKDEKFLLSLYEMAMQGDDPYAPKNKYEVGHRVGLAPKGVNTICVLLCQANFIKKAGDEEVYLTKHGENLVLRLLSES